MKSGDVFRLVGKADRHARVIISDPVNHPERILFVGMTSYDSREDHSCILLQGEHSTCVIPRTCIAYSRSNSQATNDDLDKMVKAGLIQVYEPVSDAVLARIRDGAMKSVRTPKECRTMLIEQGLVADPGDSNK